MRDEIAKGSELGKQLDCINHGKIAPPEVTMQCIKQHATNPSYKFIVLDGFPRTVEQASVYNSVVGPADLTLVFNLPEDECMQRLGKRALASGRADDNEQTFRIRFNEFYQKTQPAVDYVKRTSKYEEIDGAGSVEEVWERVKAAVMKIM